MDAKFFILCNFVHHYIRICTDSLDPVLIFIDFTKLDFNAIASLDFYSRAVNIIDSASKDLGLSVDTLGIDSHKWTVEDVTILNYNSIFSLRDDMHSSLLEVGESAIRDLKITIDGNDSSGLISLIANEITANKIKWRMRKSYKGSEFLLKSFGNGL